MILYIVKSLATTRRNSVQYIHQWPERSGLRETSHCEKRGLLLFFSIAISVTSIFISNQLNECLWCDKLIWVIIVTSRERKRYTTQKYSDRDREPVLPTCNVKSSQLVLSRSLVNLTVLGYFTIYHYTYKIATWNWRWIEILYINYINHYTHGYKMISC